MDFEIKLRFMNCLLCDVNFCPVALVDHSEDEKLLDVFCKYFDLSPKEMESFYDEQVGFPFCDTCRGETLANLSDLHDKFTSIQKDISQLVTSVSLEIVNIMNRNNDEDDDQNTQSQLLSGIRKNISARYKPNVVLMDFCTLFNQKKKPSAINNKNNHENNLLCQKYLEREENDCDFDIKHEAWTPMFNPEDSNDEREEERDFSSTTSVCEPPPRKRRKQELHTISNVENPNSTKRVKKTRKSQKKTTRKSKSNNNVSVRKSKVGRVKKIKEEDDDDPPFIPSPKSEQDEDDDDDYNEEKNIPKAKKQKKGQNDTPIVKKQRPPPDKLVQRKIKQMKQLILDKYKTRKTRVPNPCWELECDQDFPTQKDCYEHTLAEHFQPNDHVCQKCSKRCKTNYGLKFHEAQICLKLKPGELLETWPCQKCEEQGKTITFPLKKTLTQHMNQHHFEGEVKCTFEGCNFTTNVPNRMYQHNLIHLDTSTEAERTCAECQKTFKNMVIYKAHQKSMHTEEGLAKYKEELKRIAERRKERNKDKPKLSDETFCSECMVDMLTHHGLVIHQKTVHGERQGNFVCDECGTSFTTKGGWNKHKANAHILERNWFCDQCGRSFKIKATLQTHMRIAHDEEGRLKFNADIRLQTKRRKLRKLALAQSLSSGIPQFTGAQFADSNNSNSGSDVVNSNTNTSTSDYNILSPQQNFGM